MAKLVVDLSGRLGIMPNIGQSARHSYLTKDGQLTRGVWNPFIRRGFLSPANGTPEACTFDQAMSAQPASKIYDPINNDFYMAEAGRQLYKGDGTADTSLERVIQLAASSGVITDLEIYTVNDVRKLFVMYRDNADTAEIAISSLPYDTASDNETYTATVAGDNIGSNSLVSNSQYQDFFMEVADNGFAYLFMANQVHKLDGTASGGANGTMTANVLLFPTSFRIVDALDKGGFMFIALHKHAFDNRAVNPTTTVDGPTGVGVYIWDRQSTVAGTTDFIPLPGVVEISRLFVGSNGLVRALVRTSNGITEIYEFSGTSFKSICSVGFDAYPVMRDAVDTFGSMTVWLGHNGVLYMYGSVYPGDPEGLYDLFEVSLATTTTGLVMPTRGAASTSPAVYLGYQATGPSTVFSRLKIPTLTGQLGTEDMAASTNTFPVSFLPQQSVVNFIDIYCAPVTGSGSTSVGTVSVHFNMASSAWATKTITRDMAARGYVSIDVAKPFVSSVQLEIAYPATTDLSTNDFCPAFAVIDYTPSTDKG